MRKVVVGSGGVIDLSTLATVATIGDVFVFFVRNFMKSSQLVMGIIEVQWAAGSAVLKIVVSCDGMTCLGKKVLVEPANTTFDPVKHTLLLYAGARGWVAGVERTFMGQSQSPGTTYCGTRFHLIPLEKIDAIFRAEAVCRAEDQEKRQAAQPAAAALK